MDNSLCNKLEDRRDIFLNRGQMVLLASAERRNYLPAFLPRFDVFSFAIAMKPIVCFYCGGNYVYTI